MDSLLHAIMQYKDDRKAEWWGNYVKHESRFLGVPMNNLRDELNRWLDTQSISTKDKVDAVKKLFKGTYSEEKLLGILMLSEHMHELSTTDLLDLVEEIIYDVYDWNICDWLCVKAIQPRLMDEDHSSRMIKWSMSDYLWLRRAALVPFVGTSYDQYSHVIFTISRHLIQHPERFSKTAVGWVFREMMPTHKDEILAFIKEQLSYVTTEVINNILKHQPDKNLLKKSIYSNTFLNPDCRHEFFQKRPKLCVWLE